MIRLGLSGWIVVSFFIVGLFAPFIANETANSKGIFPLIKFGPNPPANILDTNPLQAPSSDHIFGTDYVGRDIAARIVHGIRNSLFFSLAVVVICLVIGVLIGGLMGFLGGRFDLLSSRVLEVIATFPIFLLQLTLLAFFDQGYNILLFVMCIAGWIPYCRFTRAEFLRLRNQEFVQASRALGSSRLRIFFRHLLPNALTPTFVYLPFDLSSTVIILGALSFLGFGEPINVASLGELLTQAKDHFQTAWWLALFPGLTLFFLTLSLALFGSHMRDWLDPRR